MVWSMLRPQRPICKCKSGLSLSTGWLLDKKINSSLSGIDELQTHHKNKTNILYIIMRSVSYMACFLFSLASFQSIQPSELKKPEETRKRETSVQQNWEKEELKALIKQCKQMNIQVEQLQLLYCWKFTPLFFMLKVPFSWRKSQSKYSRTWFIRFFTSFIFMTIVD